MKIIHAIVIASLAPSVIAFRNIPVNKLWQNHGRIMNDSFHHNLTDKVFIFVRTFIIFVLKI